jgi:hypothetical protein
MSVMALVCLASAAVAQDGDAGDRQGLSFTPHVRGTLGYDDNVFLERRGEEDDFFLWIEPGVDARWTRSKIRAGADVGLDGRFYLEEEDLTEVFWNARGFVEYQPTDDLRFEISDRYVPTALQLGAPEDTTANQEQANWLQAEAEYTRELRPRTDLEVGVRGTRFDTRSFRAVVDVDGDGIPEEDRVDVDYWEARGWLEGRHELGRDREVFARFDTARRTYPSLESADFTEYAGTVGARAAITARIRVDVAVGYGVIDFDDQGSEPRFLGELGLTYELPRDWTVRVSAARTLSSDVVGTDFNETNVRLDVRKELGRRTTVIASGFWSQFDNNAIEQEENEVVAAELRVERELTPRITAELAYRYWKNLGDFENDDFTQNRVLLGLVYRY